jgi:hypothetical protein
LRVPLLIPFADVDRRTAWLRGTLLLATLLGLIASMPGWMNTRTFPLLPIVSGFPILPAPFDQALYASLLIALIIAAWFYQAGVIYFLCASFIAYCGDQNRGQPWLYMYWVMLLLTLLPTVTAFAACRWALAVVYLWGGIQKCNARFFEKVPSWFVSPAANWHLPAFALDALRWSAASAPFLEIAISVALWFTKSRRPALVAIFVLHSFAVLFLGPLGHNYNWVVWPWNLAMIALACILFPLASKTKPTKPLLNESIVALRRSRFALAVLIPFAFLPILSYSGRWDSAFSFALYSESSATANIFVTQNFVDQLPPKLRTYIIPFPQYDPQVQGPFIFNFAPWAYEELHIPPLSEPRNFRSVFNSLRPYASEPSDLRMIVGERGGRVMFYQGETSWPLKAK